MATGISRDDGARLYEKARRVSAAAAEPYDLRCASSRKPPALRFGVLLLRAREPRWPRVRCSLANLTQSVGRCLVRSDAISAAMERTASTTRTYRASYRGVVAIFRSARSLSRLATADIDLNGSFIRKGEQIILRIIAGSRDPERSSHPHQVDVTRSDGGHFTLGAGPHSCVAAGLIRMAALRSSVTCATV